MNLFVRGGGMPMCLTLLMQLTSLDSRKLVC